jgi:cell division septum initiation protein DivIVA
VQEAPDRLLALQREHQKLLQKIRQKKKAVDGLVEKVQEMGRTLASVQPMIDEARVLDREIHTLFLELLTRKRQPRGRRPSVRAVYNMLQEIGVLSPAEWHDDPGDFVEDASDPSEFPFGAEDALPPPGAGGFSARPSESGPAGRSVRDLFRSLARALHPDKVQDEHEKVRRTEAMKDISRAYEDGDLARLLELERRWLANDAVATTGTLEDDETDRRCQALVRTNEALRAQLKELTHELKHLRRSPLVAMMGEIGRMAGPNVGADALIASTTEEIARLRDVRDFVVSFRDGKMGLDEFMAGPPSSRADHDDDDWDVDEDEEAMEAFLQELGAIANAVGSRGRKQGGRTRRR